MPFFPKKSKNTSGPVTQLPENSNNNNMQSPPPYKPPPSPPKNSQNSAVPSPQPTPINTPKLVFHCQQAQGSPTGLISGFTNVQELYDKIASCYGFPSSEILFCTLNTHRIDMENLLSAQLCLEDFIFVHRKGTKKEIELTKTEEALGLTITDNGTGYAFIKRIKKGSIVDSIDVIQIGDHIESINGKSLVGRRHVDVAKFLKEIPIGETFIMRLIEPLKSGFTHLSSSKSVAGKSGGNYGSGKETLRFRSNGPARIEKAADDVTGVAVDKINELLESFMGINDVDLSTQIWEMAVGSKNTMEFAESLDNSELESFGFTDDFIIEVWGILSDAKAGRLRKEVEEEDMRRLAINSKSFK